MQESRGEFSQPANLKIPTRLLAPRGHFKPIINLCDIIWWMLALPDALFSRSEALRARVDEIMQHLLLNGDLREMYPGGCRKGICQNLPERLVHLPNRGQIRMKPEMGRFRHARSRPLR